MVREKVSAKSDYSYKTDFEIWRENQGFEIQKNARSQPPLDSTPVGAKTPDPKTLTLPTDSSKPKEKAQKEYVPEDPDSYPIYSDSSSSKSNSSDDRKYSESKRKCRDKKKNHRKCTKHDPSKSSSSESDSSEKSD